MSSFLLYICSVGGLIYSCLSTVFNLFSRRFLTIKIINKMKFKFRLGKNRIHKSVSIFTKNKEVILKFNPFRVDTLYAAEHNKNSTT